MSKKNKSDLKRICKRQPAIICVVGESGVGKTTLVVKLVKELTKKGIRVGTIKHASKGFSLGDENKDSGRHKSAGAVTAMVVTQEKIAFVKDKKHVRLACLREYFQDVDLIIAEGFKNGDQPKICLCREGYKTDRMSLTKDVFAFVTDRDIGKKVRHFKFDQIQELASSIQSRYILGPRFK